MIIDADWQCHQTDSAAERIVVGVDDPLERVGKEGGLLAHRSAWRGQAVVADRLILRSKNTDRPSAAADTSYLCFFSPKARPNPSNPTAAHLLDSTPPRRRLGGWPDTIYGSMGDRNDLPAIDLASKDQNVLDSSECFSIFFTECARFVKSKEIPGGRLLPRPPFPTKISIMPLLPPM